MISFGLDDDRLAIVEQVRRFATSEVRPALRSCEAQGAVPLALCARYHELGLDLLEYPVAAGGHDLGMLMRVVVDEELAAGDVGIAYALGGPGAAGYALLDLGTREQIERLLLAFADGDAWSRRGALAITEERAGFSLCDTVTAAEPVPGGFRLRGRKFMIDHGGTADLCVVIARRAGTAGLDGLEAFAVERDAAGLCAGAPYEKLGLLAVPTADVILDGSVVRDDDRLSGSPVPQRLPRVLQRVRLRVAALAVGLARAAFEYAGHYALERRAFGRAIAEHQAVAFLAADMATEIDAARNLLWRAAWAFDGGHGDAGEWVAMALAHATEAAMFVSNNAVQILGGHGYIRDHPVEKWMRDAKTLALSWGTTQSMNRAVARCAMRSAEGSGEESTAS
jgi:acyl-CoA dehydrogenase